jgi:sugar phosphate isomerase/epimerase
MRYAICNETFQGWDWERTCTHVAELGYQGIEIAPFTLNDDVRAIGPGARAELIRAAHRTGLDIVGLHWLLVSPKGLSITTQDEAVRTETATYLAALADFCADVGGKILVLGSPAQRRIPPGDDAEVAADRLEQCLQPVLERAEKQGLTLCLEPLPPPEADFILNLRQAVDLVKRFQHPALRTIFDVKSASSEGVPLPELIQEFAPWIAHVHANDANRRGPGFGDTDFFPVLNALRQIGYNGYVSIEVFDYSPDPTTIARQGLAYLRRCEAGARESK